MAPIAGRSLKTLAPAGLRGRLRELAGLDALRERIDALERRLEERIDRLETQLHESREEAWDRSRERWRSAKPTANLTWDVEITGDEFVAKAEANGAFGEGKHVVEVGSGYGRLLKSCLARGVSFASYTGVDLSDANVEHLTRELGRDGVRFVHADVEQVSLAQPADAVLSSLTFKHLFPSFERALSNLARQMRPGGVALFDLIEGERRYFEPDDVTYIRWYSRPEIESIAARAGLEVAAFDEVRHHPDLTRLLVVARKPS